MLKLLTIFKSSAQPVSNRMSPTPGYSISAARIIRSRLLFSGFLSLRVLVFPPRRSLMGNPVQSIESFDFPTQVVRCTGCIQEWITRSHRKAVQDHTHQPSSAWRVPKSRKCILVPAGHLKAGTPALAKSVERSDDDAMTAKSMIANSLKSRPGFAKTLSSIPVFKCNLRITP